MANIELTLLVVTQIEQNVPRYVLRMNGFFFLLKSCDFSMIFGKSRKKQKLIQFQNLKDADSS